VHRGNLNLPVYPVFDGAASTSDHTASNAIMRCEKKNCEDMDGSGGGVIFFF